MYACTKWAESYSKCERDELPATMILPVQGSAAQQYLELFLSVEGIAAGSVPDWKRTPFWRFPGYIPNWVRQRTSPVQSQAVSEVGLLNRCVLIPSLNKSYMHGSHMHVGMTPVLACAVRTDVHCHEGTLAHVTHVPA